MKKENVLENIYDHILKTKIEAQKRYIEANTIILDKDVAFSNNLIFSNGFDVSEYPPMLFGMKVFYKNKLPNDANFVITKTPKNKMEQINDLEEKLGIDLITLFKANKVYFKFFEESDEILESVEVHFDLTNKCLRIYEYPEDEFGTSFELSEYKKLWALRKEDLENDNE